VLENEMTHQTQKVQDLKKAIALLQAALEQKNARVENHKSVVQSLTRRQDEERIYREELEVQNYH
jgi:predicted RNase H-like nuclease (RuvC/YqgF family)